jgi:PEP-CTERM motif
MFHTAMLTLFLLGLTASPAAALQTSTWWKQVELGEIQLTGDFTLFRLEEHATAPIGRFETPLTVTSVEGTFAGYVPVGATLPGGDLLAPLDWQLGELEFHTPYFQAAGPFWSIDIAGPGGPGGFTVTGLPDFDVLGPVWTGWWFTAPPIGHTGPITLRIETWMERVPEPATGLLLLPALGLLAWRHRSRRADDDAT